MKEFVCLSCGTKWYSAASVNQTCANCGGMLQETEPKQHSAPKKFELIVGRANLRDKQKT